MITFIHKHLFLVFISLCSFISNATSQQALYAINGAMSLASTLYKLDPATGAVIKTVGPTGFNHVTSLAVNPITGIMYGYAREEYGGGSLIRIDPVTGAGTLIGSSNLEIPDMAFSPSGVLYAWSEWDGSNNDDIYIIDLNTGKGTKLGECDCNTMRTGLSFMPTGELFMKTGTTISRMDPTKGSILSTASLTSLTHNMLAFNASNQGYTGVRGPGNYTFTLQKINPYTGVVTTIGSNNILSVTAIAFGMSTPPAVWYLDADGDQFAISTLESYISPGPGYTKTVLPLTDCNDADATINPLTVWYWDADGDQFAASSTQSCTSPGIGYTRTALPVTDCNDTDATINPLNTWYLDADGDQYAVSTTQSCMSPGTGYTRTVLPVTDCNDADATINPLNTWYLDADGDKYAISSTQSCTSPGAGYTRTVLPLTDCNDADATLNPLTTWYLDADGDKFAISTTQSCTSPGAVYTRTVLPVTDCDDTKVLYIDKDGDGFGTGSPIPCNGVTNNIDCDDTKILYADVDADGFGAGAPAACGLPNNTDNCPTKYNPTQKDYNNNGIGDSCDAKLDVCAAIDVLKKNLEDYMVNGDTPLKVKLDKALDKVQQGSIGGAVLELQSFIDQVQVKTGKNGLTAAEADDLINKAKLIIAALQNGVYIVPCTTPGGITQDFILPQFQPLQSNFQLSVFPNPNNGQFVIDIQNSNASKADVYILDTRGAVIEKRHLQLNGSRQTMEFSLKNKIAGLYIIKVITNDGVQTSKVIVQR